MRTRKQTIRGGSQGRISGVRAGRGLARTQRSWLVGLAMLTLLWPSAPVAGQCTTYYFHAMFVADPTCHPTIIDPASPCFLSNCCFLVGVPWPASSGTAAIPAWTAPASGMAWMTLTFPDEPENSWAGLTIYGPQLSVVAGQEYSSIVHLDEFLPQACATSFCYSFPVHIEVGFTLTANEDSCTCPLVITDGWHAFDNTNSTSDAAGQSCGGSSVGIARDHWYQWTAPGPSTQTLEVTVSMGQVPGDSKIAVYPAGACPPGPPIACADDCVANCESYIPHDRQASVTFSAQGGNSYLIQIGSQPPDVFPSPILVGSFFLCYTSNTQDCDEDGFADSCALLAGIVPDCNGNGVVDSCDVEAGGSEDCNQDGVPDECQPGSSFGLSLGSGGVLHVPFGQTTFNVDCYLEQCDTPLLPLWIVSGEMAVPPGLVVVGSGPGSFGGTILVADSSGLDLCAPATSWYFQLDLPEPLPVVPVSHSIFSLEFAIQGSPAQGTTFEIATCDAALVVTPGPTFHFVIGAPVVVHYGTAEPSMKRGDCNTDGAVDIGDAIWELAFLFNGGPEGACQDSCDTNDDGLIDIADPIRILSRLFSAGPPFPPPQDICGTDPTMDGLGCTTYPCP